MSKKIQVKLKGENEWLEFDIEQPHHVITLEMMDDIRLVEKPECNHDHATCPGDIKTIKCAYCGESLYQKPKKIEKLEEYDLLNFENLGFKINEIIEKVNKE